MEVLKQDDQNEIEYTEEQQEYLFLAHLWNNVDTFSYNEKYIIQDINEYLDLHLTLEQIIYQKYTNSSLGKDMKIPKKFLYEVGMGDIIGHYYWIIEYNEFDDEEDLQEYLEYIEEKEKQDYRKNIGEMSRYILSGYNDNTKVEYNNIYTTFKERDKILINCNTRKTPSKIFNGRVFRGRGQNGHFKLNKSDWVKFERERERIIPQILGLINGKRLSHENHKMGEWLCICKKYLPPNVKSARKI